MTELSSTRPGLKHGAFSASEIARRQRKWYDRLMWRVRTATGRTSLRTRLAIEKIAYYRARIELADEWLAEQPDPLFRDRATGELWPVVSRVDEWTSAEARYVAQMPSGAASGLGDLARQLARPRGRAS
jgi:hypothetical protein